MLHPEVKDFFQFEETAQVFIAHTNLLTHVHKNIWGLKFQPNIKKKNVLFHLRIFQGLNRETIEADWSSLVWWYLIQYSVV